MTDIKSPGWGEGPQTFADANVGDIVAYIPTPRWNEDQEPSEWRRIDKIKKLVFHVSGESFLKPAKKGQQNKALPYNLVQRGVLFIGDAALQEVDCVNDIIAERKEALARSWKETKMRESVRNFPWVHFSKQGIIDARASLLIWAENVANVLDIAESDLRELGEWENVT